MEIKVFAYNNLATFLSFFLIFEYYLQPDIK